MTELCTYSECGLSKEQHGLVWHEGTASHPNWHFFQSTTMRTQRFMRRKAFLTLECETEGCKTKCSSPPNANVLDSQILEQLVVIAMDKMGFVIVDDGRLLCRYCAIQNEDVEVVFGEHADGSLKIV